MNILCLDTSGKACSAAIACDDRIVAEQLVQNGRTHSATLMRLVDACFQYAGISPKEIDLVAVTNGPGSFTGLRIGMSTANAFAQSCRCPVAALDTLAVVAENFAGNTETVVCSLLDARRERVFCRIQQGKAVLLSSGVYPVAEVTALLARQTAPILLAGDGAEVYGEAMCAAIPRAQVAPMHLCCARAAAMADLARKCAGRGAVFSAEEAALDYFVASQAEQSRKMSGEVCIRRAQAQDLPEMLALEQECFRDPWTAEVLLLDVCASEYNRYYVLEGGGRILGYAGMNQVLDEVHIRKICIAPDMRRRGYARLLLEKMERCAVQNGAVALTLEVRRSNAAAIALYEGFGFRTEGARKKYYDNGEDALILWKRELAEESHGNTN